MSLQVVVHPEYVFNPKLIMSTNQKIKFCIVKKQKLLLYDRHYIYTHTYKYIYTFLHSKCLSSNFIYYSFFPCCASSKTTSVVATPGLPACSLIM